MVVLTSCHTLHEVLVQFDQHLQTAECGFADNALIKHRHNASHQRRDFRRCILKAAVLNFNKRVLNSTFNIVKLYLLAHCFFI